MITDIKFDCTHCGQRMVVDREAEGLSTECPCCRASITIPKVGALHDRDYQMPLGGKSKSKGKRETMPAGVGETRGGGVSGFEDPELASLRQELLEASTQVSRLEGEIAELKMAAEASTRVAEQARAEHERLQGERRKLRDELIGLKKALSAKESQVSELTAGRKAAETRVTELSTELGKVEGALTLREEEAIRLRTEVETLTNENAALAPRVDAAESEWASATEALEQTAETLRERENEIQELRTSLTEAQAARTTALRDVQSLDVRLTNAEAELTTARATVAQSEAKLQVTAEEFATTQKRLQDVEETAKSLKICLDELQKERDALWKSLSEDTTGKDLVETREHLRVTARERDSLSERVQQLTGELDRGCAEKRGLDEQLKTLIRELDEARRRAEAASEIRLRQDNEVLRGIIARQNSELEQKHVQVARLKRARLGLRLAYAAFGTGLLAVAIWAMKAVPGLQIGKLF